MPHTVPRASDVLAPELLIQFEDLRLPMIKTPILEMRSKDRDPPGLYARRPQLGNGRTRIHTRQATPEPLLEATGLVSCLIIKG